MVYEIFAFYWKWVCLIGGGWLTFEIICEFFKFAYSLSKCINMRSKLDELSVERSELSNKVANIEGGLKGIKDDFEIHKRGLYQNDAENSN